MSIILGIETATEVCSVSLLRDGNIIALKESSGSNEHSRLLTPFIHQVMEESGISLSQIDAVAVSMGPGSYTGLRIGVSTAKGLCFSLDKPLIGISTLKAMAWQVMHHPGEDNAGNNNSLLCPMIDARRMEVYLAVFDRELQEISPVEAVIIDEDSLREKTSHNRVLVFGNGSDKCKSILSRRDNIYFMDDIKATAKSIAVLAEEKFLNNEFENTAYFEPFYLKDFIAGKPHVKGLH
jgi:tRNA threonylcarbamoyladenosine biosynthesis protein TsaB